MKQNSVETGLLNAVAAQWIPPTTTFASPPASPVTGAVYIFTDALTPGVAVGGGTSLSYCRWSGSAWVAVGGAGGGDPSLMKYKGAWSSSAAYAVNDVITYNNDFYLRLIASTGAASAHVQSNASVISHSLAFSSAVTAGNLIVIGFCDEGTVDPSTVTDTRGTVYTKATAITGNLNNAAVYYGTVPSSGTCTVSYTSGGGWYCCTVSEFSAVNAIVDATAIQYGGASPNTNSITTTQAADLIYGYIGGDHSGCTFAGSGGLTLAAQANGHDANATGYEFVAGAGAYTKGFTVGGGADNAPLILVAFKTGGLSPDVDPSNWKLIGPSVTHTGSLTANLPVLGNGSANVKIGTAAQLVPALPSDATKYLDGTGAFSTPAGGGGGVARGFGASFSGAGAALAAGLTAYINVPSGGTITVWTIIVDAGTCTVKLWKIAAGTAIPTAANSINTSGVAISTGTVIRSTTVTDFTTTTVANGDIVGIHLQVVSGATQITFTVELT